MILIILIGAIIILPKSEKAGLYSDYFKDTVDSSYDTPNGIFFDNTDDEKWYCLQQELRSFGQMDKTVVFRFEYDYTRNKYNIWYAFKDDNEHDLSENGTEAEAYKTLQKIAYMAIQDKGELVPGANSTAQTPYKNDTQLALWLILNDLGPNSGGDIRGYFGSNNNTEVEIGEEWFNGEKKKVITAWGSDIYTPKSPSAYELYSKVQDYNKLNFLDLKPPTTLLMAIYTGNHQNLICVDFSQKEPEDFNFNFEKRNGKTNKTLSGATVKFTVSGTKNNNGTYTRDVGSFSIKDMELANANGSIEITIEEKFAPSGYVKDSTIYKYVIKYNSSTEKWYIDSNSSKTKTDGSVQLLGNTLSGDTLSTWLVNKPDRPHNPGPGSSSDKDTWAKEPTTITGKVWVEGQDGDKDIKINKTANNKFNSGIDTPLNGVDVNLTAKAVQYQPVYGYRYYKYVWVNDGYSDANGTWHDTSFWDYDSTVYYDNPLSNYNPNEYRNETKLIRDYVAISSKTINEAATTNGIGEYSFSTDLTTYEWTYNGTSHLISEYIENGGTVTFKYNGVSYIQTTPVGRYTKNTSSDIYSNATESGRETFNNKFKTVDLSNSIAAGAYADFSGGKSVLNIPVNGVKGGSTEYQIPASTSLNQIGTSTAKVSAKTYRVNLGLLTREIDVSLSTRGR